MTILVGSSAFCASARAGGSSGCAARPSTSRTLEPEFEKLSDEELKGKTAEFRQRVANGEALEDILFEAYSRRCARRSSGRWRRPPLRRPDDGRDRPPRGRHRRDEDGRRKDLRRHDAALPELAHGAERPSRHGQRLSRQTRSGVGQARLRRARHPRRLHPEHDALRGAHGRLRGRHHVRDERRVRLRLPARQHGGHARGHRPARPRVRDRGRGRLDPDRRGPDAADHLRRAGDGRAGLLRLRAGREGPDRRTKQAEERAARASTRPSAPAPTTSTTRSSRRSRRPSPRSTRSSARSGSRTSTTPATCSS